MEDLADAYYVYAKRVCKNFIIRDLRDYHDLQVQSNTLLLAEVFENFRNRCLKIYELDTANFFLHQLVKQPDNNLHRTKI